MAEYHSRIREMSPVFMRYKLGRLLQFLGMVILPIAIAGEVAEKMTLRDSLMLSGVGVVVFFAGWTLQQGTKP